MPAPFLPYAKQTIEEEDLKAVKSALKEDLITRGAKVKEFEEAIASYAQVPYAVAFNSGTSALMASYFAAGLTPFDRVITTPNSFIATVGAPVEMGIHPHWVDIDRTTGNLSLEGLASALNYRATRGRPLIVPVHFGGRAVDMAKLDRLINHPEAIVIEDAAHALGSSYPTGEKVGSCAYSQMTVFSFHPAKAITTGEGGMVTTRDPELYHRLLLFRDNGIERESPYLNRPEAPGYYEVQAITGNFHLTGFQAALGLSQLKRLDRFAKKRGELVALYRHLLQDTPHLTFLSEAQAEQTAYHLFVVQVDFQACRITREKVMEILKEKGIGTQVHYIPLYYHPVLKCDLQKEQAQCPEMQLYYSQALTLPLYYELTKEDVERVCKELKTLLNK